MREKKINESDKYVEKINGKKKQHILVWMDFFYFADLCFRANILDFRKKRVIQKKIYSTFNSVVNKCNHGFENQMHGLVKYYGKHRIIGARTISSLTQFS